MHGPLSLLIRQIRSSDVFVDSVQVREEAVCKETREFSRQTLSRQPVGAHPAPCRDGKWRSQGAPSSPGPAVRGEEEEAQKEGSMDSRESSMLRYSECPAQRETISPQKGVGGVKDQDIVRRRLMA